MGKHKQIAAQLKAEFDFYQRLQQHLQNQSSQKYCSGCPLVTYLMPFDLILDFLPIISQLDEVVKIPFFVASYP